MTRGRPYLDTSSHKSEKAFREAMDRDQQRLLKLAQKLRKAKSKRAPADEQPIDPAEFQALLERRYP